MARTLTDDDLDAIVAAVLGSNPGETLFDNVTAVMTGVTLMTAAMEQADKGLPTEHTRWQATALEMAPVSDPADIADAVLDEAAGTHAGHLAAHIPNAMPGAMGGLPTVNLDNHVAGVYGDVAGTIGGLSAAAKQNVRDSLQLNTSMYHLFGETAGSVDRHLDDLLAAQANQALEATLAAINSLLDEIKAKTGTIGAGTVTAISPVAASGDVTIDRGYDYYAADGRALSWTDDTPATWPDLTGATAKFYCGRLVVTGTIANPTGPATIAVQLTKTETASLPIGMQPFHVDLTLANGHMILQIAGSAWVRRWCSSAQVGAQTGV